MVLRKKGIPWIYDGVPFSFLWYMYVTRIDSRFCVWQDIPRKKQGIIFVISYYRITIFSELR
jgi:hypothetical protein